MLGERLSINVKEGALYIEGSVDLKYSFIQGCRAGSEAEARATRSHIICPEMELQPLKLYSSCASDLRNLNHLMPAYARMEKRF